MNMLNSFHKRTILPTVLGLALISWGCTSSPPDSSSLSGEELLGRLGTESAPIVLDVRSAAEFAGGHIPGAYNLEDRLVPSRLEELRQLKDREIVLYCRTGRRAGIVETLLKREGFTNIKHLTGDFPAWQRSGHPIE